MDRIRDEGTKPTSNRIGSQLPRASLEQTSSPRLQKKRSVKRVRSDAQRLTNKPIERRPIHTLSSTDEQSSDDVTRQKSTSLRDAVRKIFGRRSRASDTASQTPSSVQSTPLKHKAHRSEPPDVAKSTELPPRPNTADRATSTSLSRDSPTTAQRLRSPNAVEFPKSRQLKPLNLPAPFEDPRSTLRRRKTLPSILIPEQDAKDIAAAIASAGPYPTASSFELARESPVPVIGLTATTSKAMRRRSRSAGDLREQALQAGPARNRSDEIRLWRASIQNTVLRASGFSFPPEEPDLRQLDNATAPSTPPRRAVTEGGPAVPNRSSLRNSPPFDIHSTSFYGTEFSRDLEDRVAKLEANLNVFQRSLQKMQMDRSRRVGVAGFQPRTWREGTQDRTPSMLVDDLQLPFSSSQYRYDTDPGPRPSTAPSRPSRPARPDADAPPVPRLAPPEDPPPPIPPSRPSSKGPPPRPARPNEAAEEDEVTAQPSDNATFRSLYRMLTDERSARRQLETQVRHMRIEITDLQHQVTGQSNFQSQRSSYLFSASSEAGAGSARLRDLLGQLEGPGSQDQTPPTARPPSPPTRGSAFTEAVVSRFSGSTRQESDVGAMQDEGEGRSIYDNERTPRPDHARQFGSGHQDMEFEALDGPYGGAQIAYKLSSYQQQQEEGEMF